MPPSTNAFTHTTTLRVRYAETDQMGYVYYGRYPEYFEVGRVEALRALGLPYKELEAMGINLPVRDLTIRYHQPARYDDLLTLQTTVYEPDGARIRFTYRLHGSQSAKPLAEGETTLVFVNGQTGRPIPAPTHVLDLFAALPDGPPQPATT